MRKFVAGMAIAALAVCAGAYAEDQTLTGEPVDIACYLGGKSGEGHAACAKACADKGQPIGLAVKGADGKTSLYLVMGGGGKAAKDLMGEHMGKQVTVTGAVTEKEGMKIITASKVEAAPAKSAALQWTPAQTGTASIQNPK
jgi:hypothetical protein